MKEQNNGLRQNHEQPQVRLAAETALPKLAEMEQKITEIWKLNTEIELPGTIGMYYQKQLFEAIHQTKSYCKSLKNQLLTHAENEVKP